MSIAYSQQQVLDSLLKQGYDPQRAQLMASSIGDLEEQDNNLIPNLVEGSTYAGGQYLANKHIVGPGKFKGATRFALPFMAANLSGLGASGLTGNNFYEKASGEQLAVDLGSQIAGSLAGEKLMKGVGSALAKKATAAGAGRLLGGAAGTLAGPAGTAIGSVLGGTLASYLATKLFANEDEKMVEPGKGIDNSTIAALGGLATIASPLGKPVRKMAGKASDYVFGPNGGPGTWFNPKPGGYTQQAADQIKKFTDPLTQSDVVQDTRNAYKQSVARRQGENFRDRLARQSRGEIKNTQGMGLNYQDTLSTFGGVGDATEALGESLVNRFYKQKA